MGCQLTTVWKKRKNEIRNEEAQSLSSPIRLTPVSSFCWVPAQREILRHLCLDYSPDFLLEVLLKVYTLKKLRCSPQDHKPFKAHMLEHTYKLHFIHLQYFIYLSVPSTLLKFPTVLFPCWPSTQTFASTKCFRKSPFKTVKSCMCNSQHDLLFVLQDSSLTPEASHRAS